MIVPAVRKALMIGRDKKCVTKPKRRKPSTRYITETSNDTCHVTKIMSPSRQGVNDLLAVRFDASRLPQTYLEPFTTGHGQQKRHLQWCRMHAQGLQQKVAD